MNYKNNILFLTLMLTQTHTTLAQSLHHQNPNLEHFLEEFHNNPKAVMNQLPAKYARGQKIRNSTFNINDIITSDYISIKNHLRNKMCYELNGEVVCSTDLVGRAKPLANDTADNLVDNAKNMITKLDEMETSSLLKKELSESPWSDYYWAIYKGILGYRYADEQTNQFEFWPDFFDYSTKKEAKDYVTADLTDLLSPSEKYDLLIGDENNTLTKRMWSEGQYYYNRNNTVETWMGICHGWAPAAYMLPRPEKVISVLAQDGKTVINFYPSDIKALSSLLWANNEVPSRFVGGRCESKDAALDDNGRIVSQDCFDTNPATWHLAVVNQIGVSGRSFVMDATYDYEVWNQPVFGYKYRYFNPMTNESSDSWKNSVISLKEYSKDKFKKYRNSKAKYVVGVEMYVDYVVETNPSHSRRDSSAYDSITTVIYRYDLELKDKQSGEILGGEWYTNKHPDFLWTPSKTAKARTVADRFLKADAWPLEQNQAGHFIGIPADWTRPAISSAKNNGSPLGRIVEGLIQRTKELKNN